VFKFYINVSLIVSNAALVVLWEIKQYFRYVNNYRTKLVMVYHFCYLLNLLSDEELVTIECDVVCVDLYICMLTG